MRSAGFSFYKSLYQIFGNFLENLSDSNGNFLNISQPVRIKMVPDSESSDRRTRRYRLADKDGNVRNWSVAYESISKIVPGDEKNKKLTLRGRAIVARLMYIMPITVTYAAVPDKYEFQLTVNDSAMWGYVEMDINLETE